MNGNDDKRDGRFWSELAMAGEAGDAKNFSKLLEYGDGIHLKTVDDYDDEFWTPLMHAVEDGDMSRFEQLLNEGADVNKGNIEAEIYPITIAAEHGREEMFFRLIEQGAKIDVDQYCCPTCDMWYGFNPADLFVYAANTGSVRLCRYLRLMGVRPWSALRSMFFGDCTVGEMLGKPEQKALMKEVFTEKELSLKLKSPIFPEIIGWDRIRVCSDIFRTHDSGFWPVAVRLPQEVRTEKGARILTARACYALRLWELARRACVARGLDADTQYAWQSFGTGYRCIRYGKELKGRFCDYWDMYVSAMRDEMRRIVDSGVLVIHEGKNAQLGREGRRSAGEIDYVVPNDTDRALGSWNIDELKALRGDAVKVDAGEIWSAIVSLRGTEVAFLRGEKMPEAAGIDADFLEACRRLDVGGMKKALSNGASVFAMHHDSSAAAMVADAVWFAIADDESASKDKWIERGRDAFQCIVDNGGDLDSAGLGGDTALYTAAHGSCELVKLLLGMGADPNAPCWYAAGETCQTALYNAHDGIEFPCNEDCNYSDMVRVLYRAGGMSHLPQTIDGMDFLDDFEENDDVCVRRACFPDDVALRDRLLVQAVCRGYEYAATAAARWGANTALRDKSGRSLVRIFIEDHATFCPCRDNCSQWYMANYMLFLLRGLRVPVDMAEMDALKESCRRRGYSECLAELELLRRGVMA